MMSEQKYSIQQSPEHGPDLRPASFSQPSSRRVKGWLWGRGWDLSVCSWLSLVNVAEMLLLV